MSSIRFSCFFALVLVAALVERGSLTLALEADDTVALSNTSGAPVGVLVNGEAGTAQRVYKSYASSTGPIDVGQLTALPANNGVLGFTSGRPVAQNAFVWTNGVDTVPLHFSDEISIPITVWIVWADDIAKQKQAVADLMTTTVSIWKEQGMGVVFSAQDVAGGTRIVDATQNANAYSYYSFNCTQRSNLERYIGKDPYRINVYMVNAVAPNGVGWGDSCGFGTGFVVIASASPKELLAHELGHNFMLTHVNWLGNHLYKLFDETSVMHSASNTRKYFTQGELFRAHFWSASALNAIYAARPSQPTHDCQPEESSQQCPPIQRRIWPQGKFGAN